VKVSDSKSKNKPEANLETLFNKKQLKVKFSSIEKTFSSEGPLAKVIPGFNARAPQIELAENIATTIDKNNILLAEAGTGTGKTFAYLLPALMSEKRVVISTGSKNLQEQLFLRDLPTVKKALNYPYKVALLKGRANYLCFERLAQFMTEARQRDPKLLSDLVKVKNWSALTRTGDIGELGALSERSDLIPLITSTNDNCLGRDCGNYQDCYLVKARKKAMEAQVVVVNHHLFFADVAIKEGGFGELIPQAETYIFDEAHQLPDIACMYFGSQVSARQLSDLAKDVTLAYRTEAKDMAQLGKAASMLEIQVKDMRLALPGYTGKGDLRDLVKQAPIKRQLDKLIETLSFLYDVLKLALSRGDLIDNCFERLASIQGKLRLILDVDQTGYSYWYELTTRHFSLNITPLSVAERFSDELNRKDTSWVFTSATLAVNNQFSHFSNLLGIKQATELVLGSPFDYQTQSLFCIPRGLPEPAKEGFNEAVMKQLLPVIQANGGRCFFLCTSHNMMNRYASMIREKLDLPVFVQGESSKQQLLEQFLDSGNAVLVATGAFWEGIDVRGDALSLVIIDKLPFASPDDPLLKARVEDCRKKGGDPFQQVQLPQAVITLKQGVGRLIRDNTDRGVVILCDNRLVSRNYGQLFLSSLPDLKRTRSLDKVTNFLKDIK